MVTNSNRRFLSIYLPLLLPDGTRKTKNVCVAFNLTTEGDLYEHLSKHSTTELKKMIAIFSYNHLQKIAEKEKRSIGELIKLRLAERLAGKGGATTRFVKYHPKKVALWLSALRNPRPNARLEELEAFLEKLAATETENKEEKTNA